MMNKTVHELFDEACDVPREKREEFLLGACEGDRVLLKEVMSLLDAFDGAGDFLKDPTIDSTDAFTAAVDLNEGDMVERYRILEKIGEGSNAVVFMVEQLQPIRRRAAMKVIKLGMDTQEVIARFEAERQALAMMDHPNIAKVFDAGTTDNGRPFFIMELVKGIPITSYCDRNKLRTNQRLELFSQVCLALQHAHLKGIIHRDVKPSNVLVTLHDGTPVPKVIDFGIAKATETPLTDKTLFTRFHQFIGTPAYMSPEQAEMSGLDVDTRTDVYSLGVLLYELLTGSTPFDGKQLLDSGYAAIQRTIREKMPAMPSTRVNTMEGEGLTALASNRTVEPSSLKRQLQGDLDWIVMKALEKDRTRRYETAAGLARDVRHFLNDEPVTASPPSKSYLIRKFVRRHRSLVVSVMLILLTLVGGLIAASYFWIRAEQQAVEAERQAEKADSVTRFLDTMFQSAGPDAARGGDYTVRELLDEFSTRFSARTDLDPEIEMSVRQTVGSAYEGLGEYMKAEPHVRRAFELSKSIFGEDSLESIRASSQLAWLSFHLGNRKEGFSRLESAEQKLRAEGVIDSVTICRLASLLIERGEVARAEVLVEEIRGAQFQSDDPISLWSGQLLAGIYREQGRVREARELLVSLAQTQSEPEDLGQLRPQNLEAIHTLCQLELEQGRVGRAEQLAKDGVLLAKKLLSESHRITLLLKFDLARIAEERGEVLHARKSLESVLEVQQARLGEQHKDSLRTMLALSRIALSQEQPKEATDLASKAHTFALTKFGDRDSYSLETLRNLAGILAGQGRPEDAHELLDQSLKNVEASLGARHPETLESLRLLVEHEANYGSPRRASQLYQSYISRLQNVRGEDAEAVLLARFYYAQFLRRLGHVGLARDECLSLIKARRKQGREAALIDLLEELAIIQRHRLAPLAARPHLREALALTEKVFGKFNQRVISIHMEQVYNFISRQDDWEAITLLDRLLADSKSMRIPAQKLAEIRQLRNEAGKRVEEAEKSAKHAWSGYEKLKLKSILSQNRKQEIFKERVVLLRLLRRVKKNHKTSLRLAEDHYQEALEIYADHRWMQDQAMFLKGKLLESLGESDEAKAVLREVVDGYLDEGSPTKANSAGQLNALIRLLITDGNEAERSQLVDYWQDQVIDAHWSPQEVSILVPKGSDWHHRFFRLGQSRDWMRQPGADLGEDWESLMAPIGYHVPGLNSVMPRGEYRTHINCFHHEFEVEDPSQIEQLKFRYLRDDGIMIYFNGEEVYRDNVARTNTGVGVAAADIHHLSQVIHVAKTLSPKKLKAGRNIVSVELFQYGDISEDMIFDLQLEAKMKTPSKSQ